ncbi:MAG: hypothetical protein LUC50_08660 [Ruminococcus sp.]|nr:hypothetical protein [Ruminococcus sp.]
MRFFAFQHHFYLVKEKIETNGIQFDAIHRCNAEQINILLKILAYQFSALAENGIMHSDVKPDNLLLKSTIGDYFTVKIIDFDASFLEKIYLIQTTS